MQTLDRIGSGMNCLLAAALMWFAWLAAMPEAWAQSLQCGDRVGVTYAGDYANIRDSACGRVIGQIRAGNEGQIASSSCSQTCSIGGTSYTFWNVRPHGWIAQGTSTQRWLVPMPGSGYYPDVSAPGAYPVRVYNDVGSVGLRVRLGPGLNYPEVEVPPRTPGETGIAYAVRVNRSEQLVWWRIRWSNGDIGWSADSRIGEGVFLIKTGSPSSFTTVQLRLEASGAGGSVGILVGTPDLDAAIPPNFTVSTPATLRYVSGDRIRLTAPQTAPNGAPFQRWLRNGSLFSNQRNIEFNITSNDTFTAVYAYPTNTISIRSRNPDSGVRIEVSPPDNNGNGSGTTPFTRTYNRGTTVTLTAPAQANGNRFVRWELNGQPVSTSTSYPYTVSGDDTLTAVYEATPPPRHTLTVQSRNPDSGVRIEVSPPDNNGNGSGTTPFTRTYNRGTTVTLTAPAQANGNRFVRWELNGQPVSTSTSYPYTVSGDDTLTAVYEATPPPRHTLTVQSRNPDSGVRIEVSPPDNNGNGSGTTPFTRTYNRGTTVTLTAPAQANGNRFVRWELNGQPVSTSTSYPYTVSGDDTLTAVYEATPPPRHTLTVQSRNPDSGVRIEVSPPDNNGNGSGTTPFTRTYNRGTTVTLTAPAQANGNRFVRWELNGQPVSTSTSYPYTVSGDDTLTAVYEATPPPRHTLTVQSRNPDSGVRIEVSPPDNNGNGSGTTPFTRTYNRGTTVTLTAPAQANGNRFVRWELNGQPVSTSTSYPYTVSGDDTLTAVYEATPPPRHTLTVQSRNPDSGVRIEVSPPDNNGNGSGTTPFTRTYNRGTTVTLTAPAQANGNRFVRWELNGQPVSTSTSYPYTVSGDDTLTAVYEATPPPRHTLTVQSRNPDSGVRIEVSPPDNNGNGSGTTPFTRTYNRGTTVTLTAPAQANGNRFVRWELNGQPVSTSTSYPYTVSGDDTLTAVYEATQRPDLFPELVDVTPNPVRMNDPLRITVRVHNIGRAASSPCSVEIFLGTSGDSITSARRIRTEALDSVLPGQHRDILVVYTPRDAGTFYLWVRVDPRNTSGQSDTERGNDTAGPRQVTVTSELNLRLPIAPVRGNPTLSFVAQTYQGTPAPPYGHGNTQDEWRRVVDLYPARGQCVEESSSQRRQYPVIAAHAGTIRVIPASNRDIVACREYRQRCGGQEHCAYKTVIIENSELGIRTYYVHLKPSDNLRSGMRVQAGDPIGTVDDYGYACTGPHLHFAVQRISDGKVLPLDDGTVTFDGLNLLGSGTPCPYDAPVKIRRWHSYAPPGGELPEVDIFLAPVEPAAVSRGGSVLVQGVVSPPEEGRRVTVMVTNPEASDSELYSFELHTDASGAFQVEVPIPASEVPGRWHALAYVHEQQGYDDLTSNPAEFTVINLAPTPPIQVSPRNGETTAHVPTLVVEGSDPEQDQVKFKIELERVNDSSARLTFETELMPSGSRATVSVPTGLADGGWRWRVRAVDQYGAESEWSEWSEFSVSGGIPTRLHGVGTFALNLQPQRASIQDLFGGAVSFVSWNPTRGVYEPATTLELGKAYWFKTDAPVTAYLSGASVATFPPITLVPGWNLIPSPGRFFMDPTAIQVRNGAQVKTLEEARIAGWVEDYMWAWYPNPSNPMSGNYRLVYDSRLIPGVVDVIEPWRGYWIYAYTNCELRFATSRADRSRRSQENLGWALRIRAESDGSVSEVIVGASQKRELAVAMPPLPPGETNAVRLSAVRGGGALGADIRRGNGKGQWDIEVEVAPFSEGREVVLSWHGVASIPRSTKLVLVDLQTNQRQFMHTTASYTFRSAAQGGKYRFRIESVPASTLLRILNPKVNGGRGGQYTLSFGLTGNASVSIVVEDGHGRQVRILESNRSRSAGTHTAVWDGRDQQGVVLPPGQYMLSIQAISDDGQVARAVVPLILTR
jgi:hypothetical protein